MEIRLQKILSEAGVASRRKSEELILWGKVEVDGKIVKELGFKADPIKSIIKVNGKKIAKHTPKVYYVLNKPEGYISSRSDEEGRKTVLDLIKTKEYLYPVGRLDYNSSGLLILTNDGDAANDIMHPKKEIDKVYIAKIKGHITEEDLNKFRNGMELEDFKTSPAKARVLDVYKNSMKLEVIIHEGKNRQIRRMFEELGYKVLILKRIQIGPIILGGLPPGEYRELKNKELKWVKSLKEGEEEEKPQKVVRSRNQQPDRKRTRRR